MRRNRGRSLICINAHIKGNPSKRRSLWLFLRFPRVLKKEPRDDSSNTRYRAATKLGEGNCSSQVVTDGFSVGICHLISIFYQIAVLISTWFFAGIMA